MTPKQLRTLEYARQRLFNSASWIVPQTRDDFLKYDFLERKVDLSNRRVILLTDNGIAHFRSIVRTVDDANVFDGMASFSDIWSAMRAVLASCVGANEQPTGALDLVDELRKEIGPKVRSHSFLVPVYGVQFEEDIELTMGGFCLRPLVGARRVLSGLDDANQYGKELVASLGGEYVWISGEARGTRTVAEGKFRSEATLTLGMLAVIAASRYQLAGLPLCVGLAMSPQEAYGYCGWLSWDTAGSGLSVHREFVTNVLRLSAESVVSLHRDAVFVRGLAIAQRIPTNDLEGAIRKATYWFGDAQRDQERVMQFVKYWSCIEAFFSLDATQVTKDIAIGVASVLTCGDYSILNPAEYLTTKRDITKLYKLRSQALHGASHDHVSDGDVLTVSKWAAWIVINMISLSGRGYESRAQTRALSQRLEGQMIAGRDATKHPTAG